LQLLDFFSSTARDVYLLLFTLALRNLNVVWTFECGENFEWLREHSDCAKLDFCSSSEFKMLVFYV
jgi:hypothetical protein